MEKEQVKNRVVIALLQAYLDILDYDGMKSVLKEAELLHIKDYRDVNPNDTLDFNSFQKIIDAQNLLLFGCYRLLYEIGKKFSFYLFPFGKDFREIIKDINELINTNWKVNIIEQTENSVTVEIENCIFCPEAGEPCKLFTGFLIHSLKKSLPDNRRVTYVNEDEELEENQEEFSYLLKLNWK